MAAPGRTPRARPTYIYPPSDHSAAYSDAYDDEDMPFEFDDEDMPFEFDEADAWSNGDVARIPSFGTIRSNGAATPGSRAPRRPPRRADISSDPKPAAASLPVNIPDWSKINMTCDHADGGGRVESDEEGEDDREGRVPPHEYLARRRGASLSVHEGIGRTLKGRDLRRVRDAIWKAVGFTD